MPIKKKRGVNAKDRALKAQFRAKHSGRSKTGLRAGMIARKKADESNARKRKPAYPFTIS